MTWQPVSKSKRSALFGLALRWAKGMCETCHVARAEEVYERTGTRELHACCTPCRRKCFGIRPEEAVEENAAAAERQGRLF